MANVSPDPRAPYVGKSAFAHKGVIHVSAVLKDSPAYEHVTPLSWSAINARILVLRALRRIQQNGQGR